MNGTRRTGDRTRAQTTLDFAIAMGIFLLAIAFVFSFVPTFVAPFADGDQELSAASDRIASHLAEGALADVDDPGVVRETCATPFFDSATAPGECGYDGDDTRTHLGIGNRFDVEVELVRNHEGEEAVLCLNGDGYVSHEEDDDCDDTYYNVSTTETFGDRGSVTVSRRTVTIDGSDCDFDAVDDGEACDVTMYVRVW